MARICKKCGRTLYKGEDEDVIRGDCGLERMFSGFSDCLCVKKKAGEPLTKEMIEQALKKQEKTNQEQMAKVRMPYGRIYK